MISVRLFIEITASEETAVFISTPSAFSFTLHVKGNIILHLTSLAFFRHLVKIRALWLILSAPAIGCLHIEVVLYIALETFSGWVLPQQTSIDRRIEDITRHAVGGNIKLTALSYCVSWGGLTQVPTRRGRGCAIKNTTTITVVEGFVGQTSSSVFLC